MLKMSLKDALEAAEKIKKRRGKKGLYAKDFIIVLLADEVKRLKENEINDTLKGRLF